ncbi:ABC transporter ATP-binding protein [Salsuginibacillus kocurii]|uniref:ABC transporter ATP-binding protein n=1 Tax=Salsuginibacillus kocurii TaxID=427078 RepID=UPI000372D40A|nr:ATP-binding cassette domain-containing protein [Salsuginibacillus kocurii]
MSLFAFEDVSLKRSGQTIIEQMNWKAEKEEHWALIGLNGAGKTSLLKMLTGFLWPTNGQVHIFGTPMGGRPVQEVRQEIGWVSDDLAERFRMKNSMLALEAVASGAEATVGLYEAIEEENLAKAEQLMYTFRIGHCLERSLGELSQGEKQRVLLARAWMTDCKLLILDEPLSGLDIKGREESLQAIHELSQQANGPKLLYVTHHIEEIVPSITHVAALKNGEMLVQGKKADVLNEQVLSNAFGLPVKLRQEHSRTWLQTTIM